MSDENTAVVRRFVEQYQSADHDVSVAEELLAEDFVDHSPFGPFSPDRRGVIALFRMFFEAFPDLRADIKEQYADGDRVITRKTFHGTHKGAFMGIPGTGNPVAFDVIDIITVRDGTMRDHSNVVDSLALMTGVGAIPPMG